MREVVHVAKTIESERGRSDMSSLWTGEAGSKEATNSIILAVEFQSGRCPKYRLTSDGGTVLLQLWIESTKKS